MAIELWDYQLKAVDQLKNGSVLCGGVGSGKSRTALAYYLFRVCDGSVKCIVKERDSERCYVFSESYQLMQLPRDLYIITTAKKRDSLEWQKECSLFCLYPEIDGHSGVKVTIDSWNNIAKYKKIVSAFFIFDEQRVIGSGSWVKNFLDIARKNQWILLSATPGDQWTDYIPVFVANGFYRNKTEFCNRHCRYSRFSKYPKIEGYYGEPVLERLRDQILVPMEDQRTTKRQRIDVFVDYDKEKFKQVYALHWDPFEQKPIEESGKWVYLMRKVLNSDPSRIEKISEIFDREGCIIVFYNYNYELEMLRNLCKERGILYGEWNGQVHSDVPKGESWMYLVQYSAGCEGWNCTKTDTIVFYSQSYSYRQTEQAAGRIDRINTPFETLKYYHLRSKCWLDMMIYSRLKEKKNFNESSIKWKKGV